MWAYWRDLLINKLRVAYYMKYVLWFLELKLEMVDQMTENNLLLFIGLSFAGF